MPLPSVLSACGGAGADAGAERLPQPGDVVEYPLSDVVLRQLDEEERRDAGVALLVGRNRDRGDARALRIARCRGSVPARAQPPQSRNHRLTGHDALQTCRGMAISEPRLRRSRQPDTCSDLPSCHTARLAAQMSDVQHSVRSHACVCLNLNPSHVPILRLSQSFSAPERSHQNHPSEFLVTTPGSLPEDALDLCEVEPLRREEPGSARWVPDELLPSAYVRLGELKVRAHVS